MSNIILNQRTKTEYLEFLDSWNNTPYRHDMCIKGSNGGVDCVRFVTAVCEWLHGRNDDANCFPFKFSRMAGWCEKLPGIQVLKWFTERYEIPTAIYQKNKGVLPPILAGDLMVLDDAGDSPVHLMVGGYENTVWHSTEVNKFNHGVRCTSVTKSLGSRIWRIWRINASSGLQ